jgi:hypothetical protein
MVSLSNSAQFLASLLIPVTLETIIRKSRRGFYLGCIAIVLFVIGKEFIYDVFIAHQHPPFDILSDSGDSIYYLLGLSSALIVVLLHPKNHHMKKSHTKKLHAKKGRK